MDQAEKLRNIIKANQLSSQRPAARIITVTSGKGGVGKSNTAINLAVQFKKQGKRIVILDADFGLANIEIMFGTMPKYNLGDLIYQGKTIAEIITKGPNDIGFISGGSGISGLANLEKDNLDYIVRNLAALDRVADIIIIDTGAGISDTVMEFLIASGEILLVTTPEPTSITDSYSLLKALYTHPYYTSEGTQIRMIANRVSKEEDGEILFSKLNSVVAKYLDVPLSFLGAVPQDTQLYNAVMHQVPVSIRSPKAKSTLAYEKIAKKLMDTDEEEESLVKRGITSFFSRIVSGKKDGIEVE